MHIAEVRHDSCQHHRYAGALHMVEVQKFVHLRQSVPVCQSVLLRLSVLMRLPVLSVIEGRCAVVSIAVLVYMLMPPLCVHIIMHVFFNVSLFAHAEVRGWQHLMCCCRLPGWIRWSQHTDRLQLRGRIYWYHHSDQRCTVLHRWLYTKDLRCDHCDRLGYDGRC